MSYANPAVFFHNYVSRFVLGFSFSGSKRRTTRNALDVYLQNRAQNMRNNGNWQLFQVVLQTKSKI